MMTFYIIFCVIALYAETSTQINTRNLFKKIGLFLVVVSCLLEFSGVSNHLLEFGALLYITSDIWRKRTEAKENEQFN